MKAKTKPRKRQSRLTATTVVTAQQPKMSIFELLFVAGLILTILCIMLIVANYFSLLSSTTINETTYQSPKDIDWFYNRSSYLSILKIRINDIDNQTNYFISKHGTDETGYDDNEKDRIASLRGGLNMLKYRYSELAAEYNSNAADMNRSWNKTLPRQIYDIP
jgi:hypothetical protein